MSDAVKDELNRRLARIGAIEKTVAFLAEECERKLAPIRKSYDHDMAELREEHAALVCELVGMSKHHKQGLFSSDNDRLELAAGAIIYSLTKPLIKRKDIVSLLDGGPHADLILVVKAADWDKIDKLADSDLTAIGIKRRKKIDISYEVK